MIRTEEEHFAIRHYGTPRHSGRYPWGSGGNPAATRNRSFLDNVAMLKKEGMTETQIAEGMGITTTELRAKKSIQRAELKQSRIGQATHLREKGWSHQAIAERMGLPGESSVRSLLREGEKDKANALHETAEILKKEVDKKKYIDVGVGVHHQINVTRNRLDTAVAVLREKGYVTHVIKVQQLGTGKFTNMRVLAKPGTSLQEVQRNRKDIKQIQHYSDDHGRSFLGIDPPISVSQRRIGINYKGEGGEKADGVIYVRPGVKDLSIGKGSYSQVRIMVDGTHYLKGMAVYKEGLPEGTDLVFNTSKSNTGRKKDAMKEIEKDADNPFGSIVEQIRDPKTRKVTSALNLVNEEGSWDKWNRTLSSQMLSKQDPKLITQQLDLTHERRRKEYDEIISLTNPTVRKDLLEKFADQTDAAAVHLKAANMKRQATKVILPIPSVKETEVYAPSFRDGERVVLIRHPHGGTFEIPELTVNNKNRDARKTLGIHSQDAIGINHKVAQHLSGADFDGDTVLVIPNKGSIQRTPALKELKEFDPQTFKIPKDSPITRMTDARKQPEMGKISNLITDMTIGGAKSDELARAVKHSMIVIDAVNHELDFKRSEQVHGIASLKEKYQGGKGAGAATLISRARSPMWIDQKQPRAAARGGPVDPVTGKKVFEPTGFMITTRSGERRLKKMESKRLIEEEDAFNLIGTPSTQVERIYAEHSNRLKAMANTARKEALNTKSLPMNDSAKKAYSSQVMSINAKLDNAERNAPYERQAQLLANVVVGNKKQANPHMPKADEKKIKQQALNEMRIRTRAKKHKIILTQSEWEAIQAGAISKDKLQRILNNSDIDTVKHLAMPKHTPKMTSTMKARASRMLAEGYTQADVADALGVGLTTLKVGISE